MTKFPQIPELQMTDHSDKALPSSIGSPTPVTRLQHTLSAFEDVRRQAVMTLLTTMRSLDPAPLIVGALIVSAKVSHDSIDVHVSAIR